MNPLSIQEAAKKLREKYPDQYSSVSYSVNNFTTVIARSQWEVFVDLKWGIGETFEEALSKLSK